MLTEEQLDKMTLREIAKASPWSWASPAILTRLLFPVGLKKIPLPKKVKEHAPILGKVSKWPEPQERFRDMMKEDRDDGAETKG